MTRTAFAHAMDAAHPRRRAVHEVAVVEANPFLASHVEAIVARAETLQCLGETGGNPRALVRAARLFTIAIRMAAEVDRRVGARFSRSDLAHVRDELREVDRSRTERAFREVAARIEQRIAS